MERRVKILEFDGKGVDAFSLFYELQLSPESHAAGGITRHADGRLVIALSDVDADKIELIKQKLGEPKKVEEKRITSLPPSTSPPVVEFDFENVAKVSELECPFCHAKIKLKLKITSTRSTIEEADILNGAIQS